MTSYLIIQNEQGQTPEVHKEDTQSITGQSNGTNTHMGGDSVGDSEKAGWKADSVQSIENRQFYKTKEEKHQFIHESFQLDTNEILNADAKLKDNFKVLATHPSQYAETKLLVMKIDLVQGAFLYKSRVRLLNPD